MKASIGGILNRFFQGISLLTLTRILSEFLSYLTSMLMGSSPAYLKSMMMGGFRSRGDELDDGDSAAHLDELDDKGIPLLI